MHFKKTKKILATSMLVFFISATTVSASDFLSSSSTVSDSAVSTSSSSLSEETSSTSDTGAETSSSSSSSENDTDREKDIENNTENNDTNTSSDSSSSSSEGFEDTDAEEEPESTISSSENKENENPITPSTNKETPAQEKESDIPVETDHRFDVEEKKEESAAAEKNKKEEIAPEKSVGDVDEKEREQAKKEIEKKPEEERTNEALIKTQNIQTVAPVALDWRMAKIDKESLYATERIAIREDKSKASLTIGILEKGGEAFLLSEEEEGWLYIESGNVRGFALKNQFLMGEEAVNAIKNEKIDVIGDSSDSGIVLYQERHVPQAKATVWPEKNKAFGYKNVTTQEVVCTDKALTKNSLAIFEERKLGSRKVGQLKKGDLVYVLKEYENGINGIHGLNWIFIESGDVRGFVLDMVDRDAEIDEDNEKYDTATEIIKREENAAWWASVKSIKEGSTESALRQQILEYAQQFVGNRYIWGGNDPHVGADCSGFVKYVYAHFGYSMPRVADDQARVGKQIRIQDVSPGDLVFWAENGYVYHVAMYAGNGETIEAYSSAAGIVHIKRNISQCVWAVRMI